MGSGKVAAGSGIVAAAVVLLAVTGLWVQAQGIGFAPRAGASAGRPDGVYTGSTTVTGVQPLPDGSGGPTVGATSPTRIEVSCQGTTCTLSGTASYQGSVDGTTLTGGGGTWRGSMKGGKLVDCPAFDPSPIVLTGDADQVTLTIDTHTQRVDCGPGHFVERPGVQTRFTGTLQSVGGPATTAPVSGVPTTSPTAGTAPAPVPSRAAAPTAAVAAMSPYQRASAAAVARRDRSTVSASLTTPGDAREGGLRRAAENTLIAGALVLLLAFPSVLFNSTYDANKERVDAVVRSRLRRARGGVGPSPGPGPDPADAAGAFAAGPRGAAAGAETETGPASDAPGAPRGGGARAVVVFLLVAAGGAVVGQFLDPHAGLDLKSAALFTGILASTLIGVAVAAGVGRSYRTVRRQPTAAVLTAAPVGLLIAAGCVAVSRAVHFQPGYLFGLIGGVTFTMAMSEEDQGRHQLVDFVVGLAVALVAWVAFVPVARAANHVHAGFPVLAADAFLSAVFIGGIEGLLLSLTPLRFLPGHRVARWSWAVWGVLAFVAAFTFVHVLLRPSTGYLGASSTASVTVTVGLFVAFGAGSVAFWSWFRLHPTESDDGTDDPLDPVGPAGPDADRAGASQPETGEPTDAAPVSG